MKRKRKAQFVLWKVISWNYFSKEFYIFLSLKKLVKEKTFSIKKKFSLFLNNFFFYLEHNSLSKSFKKLKLSLYLLIVTDFIFNFLIAIYLILNYFFIFIFFHFHLLGFDIYINFSPHSFDCYFFLIETFYLLDLIFIFLLLFILFEIIYEIKKFSVLPSFNFFIC